MSRIDRHTRYQELRDLGMTHQEIADACGVTHQTVSQTLENYSVTKRVFHIIRPTACIYDGLRGWLNKNQISISELCRRVGTLPYGGCPNAKNLRNGLAGKAPIKNRDIDGIIEVTHMSYEDLFRGGKTYENPVIEVTPESVRAEKLEAFYDNLRKDGGRHQYRTVLRKHGLELQRRDKRTDWETVCRMTPEV